MSEQLVGERERGGREGEREGGRERGREREREKGLREREGWREDYREGHQGICSWTCSLEALQLLWCSLQGYRTGDSEKGGGGEECGRERES